MSDIESTILLLLYYSSEPLSEESLVTRISALQDQTTELSTLREDIHKSLVKLTKKGMCKFIRRKDDKLGASLTDAGLRSFAGHTDERLEIRKMPAAQFDEELVATGVPGLDDLMEGGIPAGSIVLVRGPPGSGKTILCGQFLTRGLEKDDHNAIFVSFDVSKLDFLKQMRDLALDFERFDGNRFEFVDAVPIRLIASNSRFKTDNKGRVAVIHLCEEIEEKAKEHKAKRIVIDTLTSLSMLYEDAVERRMGMLALFEAMHKLGCTAFVTAEAGALNTIEPEEYLSDGVISLDRVLVGRAIVRSMSVTKMRRRAIDIAPKPYQITPRGIQVFPKESVY